LKGFGLIQMYPSPAPICMDRLDPSFAHAAVMGTQAMRNMVAREELVGVSVLVVIGVTLIALAPVKQGAAIA